MIDFIEGEFPWLKDILQKHCLNDVKQQRAFLYELRRSLEGCVSIGLCKLISCKVLLHPGSIIVNAKCHLVSIFGKR